jgi:hypothetical protein
VSDDRARPMSWHAGRRLLVALLCAAVLVAVGVYVGERSSRGTKHAQVVQGVAMRANSENDLVMFDGEDGTRLQFGGDHMWWRSGEVVGDGNPPCLRRPQRRVSLQVGLMQVARPDGGSFEQAVWVECS